MDRDATPTARVSWQGRSLTDAVLDVEVEDHDRLSDRAVIELSDPGGMIASIVLPGHSIAVDAPKTKLLAQKFKAMGLESVMVIADQVDENLALASRNLANVLVIEPRYADPVSLVFYKKVLVTKAAIARLEEMFA